MWFKFLSIVATLSVTYFSTISHAQYLTGPVASALGGAGRAAVDDGEQALINPASVVHGSNFTSEIIYLDGYLAENTHDNAWAIGLTDNSEGLPASGGFYYAQRRRTFDASSTLEEKYHQFSMGRFLVEHLSMGLAITYLDTKVIGGGTHKQWDGNLGFHYNPQPDLGFGLVLYNILSRDEDVPAHVQNQDSIFLAVNYLYIERFRFRLDIGQQQTMNPDREWHWQAGLESKIGDFMVTRVGYDNDGLLEQKAVTFGLGFDGPKIKADYFYRLNTEYSGGAMHGVDIRLPFW